MLNCRQVQYELQGAVNLICFSSLLKIIAHYYAKMSGKVRLFRFFLFTLHAMKKVFLWIGGILLSPILLFILLTALLYLPPVQNWAVDRVTAYASEETGMQITIDRIDLDFPLDLGIEGIQVISQQGDTIADIVRLVADVELMPLMEKKVVVNELMLEQAKVNTTDFISDLQIRGHVGLLSVQSKGIDLDRGIVELNGAQVADADLTILLSDTAAVDTTTSETPWLINVDSLSVLRSRVTVHMPGDSMQVMAYMGQAQAQEAVVNLAKGVYTVRTFSWQDGQLTYDQTYEPRTMAGIDYNHIALSGVCLALDSIYYSAPNLALKIRETALREQSGLAITSLRGPVLLDSTGIELPSISLSTPYSYIHARADVDFNVMDDVNPGQLRLKLNAQLGKPDLMFFMADMPKAFQTRWPEWPLSIEGSIDGNMQRARIQQLEVSLPTAFKAST